jgi:hypothetical protein
VGGYNHVISDLDLRHMDDRLPAELTSGAILRNGEYAWELPAFHVALQNAPSLGYACLGGQFWFVLPNDSLYEPFWLEANSSDKAEGEAWSDYARRSCSEVLVGFKTLVERTDVEDEARKFGSLESPFHVMFNAYFVTEEQFFRLGLHSLKSLSGDSPRG